MKRLSFILFSIALLFSCNKDIIHVGNTVNITDNPDETDNPLRNGKKIRESIKIHDDNVNGVALRVNQIQEAVYYYYNDKDLLNLLMVYSDTNKTTLTKRMQLEYFPSERRIHAMLYYNQTGNYEMDFYYDQDFKLLKISTIEEGNELGLFYIYSGDTLKHFKTDNGVVSIATNMQYDNFMNLTEYEIYPQNESYIKTQLEYDYNFPIEKTFDTKLVSIEIKFLYEGGVNVIDLMGLNLGLGNTHILKKRTETRLEDSSQVRNTYEFTYEKDAYGRLTKRKVRFNDRAEATYEFRY